MLTEGKVYIMKQNKRESNFELMRLISMFFIVLYHFLIATGGDLINHTTGITTIILEIVAMLIIVHVNSFVLITGYFQCQKKFSWSKTIKLISMAWFYKIIIGAIFYYFGGVKLNLTNIILLISPLEFENNWFLTVYISLILISPYINIMLDKLSQQEHRKLVLLLVVMFSIIPTITNQHTFSNYGFSIIHFVFVYILGAYLKKYPINENIHFQYYSNKKKIAIFICAFLFCGIFNFLLYEFCKNIIQINNNNFIVYMSNCITENMFNYQNPILIVQSISYFLIFETLKVKNKLINLLASNIFAIYIITENPYIRGWMYSFLGYDKVFLGPNIILKTIIYSIIVFIICILIELLRKLLFRLVSKINYWKTHKLKHNLA